MKTPDRHDEYRAYMRSADYLEDANLQETEEYHSLVTTIKTLLFLNKLADEIDNEELYGPKVSE